MNTLQDLRDTLDAHAVTVHDDPAIARVAAVHGRARALRRRRAAGVAAAAVLAVGAASAVSLLPDDRRPAPADRVLIGREAPVSLHSLEYTYAFADGVEDDVIELEASDEPRLLSWATDADRARLVDLSGDGPTTVGNDFDDFVLVAPGVSGRWQLRTGGAPAAFAVYELTGIVPAGDYAGGLFFRNEVADDVLIDATAAPADGTELTFTFTAPERQFRLAEFCSGVSDDYWVNVSINGNGAMSSGGCADDPFDPGAGNGTWYDVGELGVEAGRPVEVRMWVSRGIEGPQVDLPGTRLALAAYDVPAPTMTMGDWEMPDEYEYGGHTWRFVAADVAPPGAERWTARDEIEGPALALVATTLGKSNRYRVSVGSEPVSIGAGVGSQRDEVPLGMDDERVSVVVRRGATPTSTIGIAFYRRVD